MRQALIQFDKVSKAFGSIQILKEDSLLKEVLAKAESKDNLYYEFELK